MTHTKIEKETTRHAFFSLLYHITKNFYNPNHELQFQIVEQIYKYEKRYGMTANLQASQ